MKKKIKYILISVSILIAFPVLFLILKSPGSTSSFNIDNSIAEINEIDVNGTSLFTVIRGKSKNNPILLMLHGGPGTTELPMMRKFNHSLEKDFTVVYYDQRGASNSYHEKDSSNLNLKTMIEDTHALTNYLKGRFNQKKIFIIGHSWGSYLALHTVHQYPEDYYAYIGTGQISNQLESEKLGYLYALDQAIIHYDSSTIAQLINLGQINVNNKTKVLPWVFSQRQFLDKYHVSLYEKNTFETMIVPILTCEELTLSDKIGIMNGTFLSLDKLFPNVLEDNLCKSLNEFEVPIYFLQGKHDYVTSYALAKKYMHVLKAPIKKLITFDRSAHSPNFEEPQKFNQTVKDLFLHN